MVNRLQMHRSLSQSRCRRHQAHYHPLRLPRGRGARRTLRAAVPGCEDDAVAAGGAAQGAGREEGGWDVHAVRPQGSARAHGPLHLPGGELAGESPSLRLRERYRETSRPCLFHVFELVCCLSARERRECSNLERERTVVYRRSEREQRVWVCLQEKVFVTLPETGTLDTVAIECIT